MNRRSGLTAVLFVFGLGLVTGCPDNPYEADTWISKLDNPVEIERAITELEHLGDPKAIPGLAKAWDKQGRPVRILQVIIDLARPLDKEQADKLYLKPREASWNRAVPVLIKAIEEIDDANPRSVDSAVKAADALGESKSEEALQPLIDLVNKQMAPKGQPARLAAVKALGEYREAGKDKAVAALSNLLRQDADAQPLPIFGAAINALANLRTDQSVPVLLETMYRLPPLFSQIRRALVASGPGVAGEVRKILRGEQEQINALFKEKKLDRYCGDKNELPPDQCKPISMREFYAAIIIGDLYDAKSVPDLLAALDKPPLPVYYSERIPSPNTQHNAIYDALRKIGAAEAAGKVKSVWANEKADTSSRALAAGAYGFLARDTSAVGDLAKVINDSKTDAGLRQELLTTYARLAASEGDLGTLQRLADLNHDKYVEAKKKADGKEKIAYDKAKSAIEAAKKKLGEAKAAFIKAGGEKKASAEIINGVTEAQKVVDAADEKFDDARAEWKPLDNERQAFLDFTRGLELHIARVEIALHCKGDAKCYGEALSAKPDDIAKRLGRYIKNFKEWTADDKKLLPAVQIERAMLELGKMGAKAESQTALLLDAAKSDDRVIRQSILLALPKIAKLPCTDCEAKLDEAIKAGEGKTTLGELNVETQMLRNYFSWAGK